MIEFVLLAILFFVGFGLVYYKNHEECKLMDEHCPMEDVYRKEISDFEYKFDEPVHRDHKLCYKNPSDFRDLKEYNWWDFHDGSGQRVYAGGTLPTFGLWTNKYNLRAPHCLKAKFDWRFDSPCRDPHEYIRDIDNIPNYPFPAECNDIGRCRIRNVHEDHIKNL